MKGRTKSIKILVLLFLLSACSVQTKKQQEISSNIELLQQLENQDIEKVNADVMKIQKELTLDRQLQESGVINYRAIFSNAVIMGDSIAAGLTEYDLLNAIQVVASRGKNLATIEDDMETVIQLVPADIFLSYGMNDLGYCNGNAKLFIERYESVIQQLKEKLPSTVLHVNAILPIQQHAIDEHSYYGSYPAFNEAMKEMCDRLGIDYIDNSSLISDNGISYNPDGVHPMYDFFPLWLNHMAERL